MSPRPRKLCSRPDAGESDVATLPEPPTFSTIARQRVREHLGEYRELVARAVEKPLDEQALARVLDLLDSLRLPHLSWSRDVTAWRGYHAAQQAAAQALERRPATEKRLREVADRIREIEQELGQLRQERYTLGEVEPATRAQYLRTCNELSGQSPHLLLELEESIGRWMDRHHREESQPATETSEPVTVGAWQ